MLIALYEIRNNRGVGHAGGDVNPNLMDATAVLYMSKWLLAELIRVLHDLTTEQASRLVEGLIEREVPHIWTDGSKKRVLKSKITWKQKALLLLLSESEAISEQELFRWSEHSNASRFRREVLRPAHKEKLIEFDEIESTVQLLPPGIAQAEDLVNSI
ncbi:hypothetical protein Salbus254_3583 [Streptomyces albidoflavus]|nr:hypothetical protein Salbus254_3583 [Streptomyces albidoflavus]